MGDYDKDTAFIGQSGRYFWAAFFLLNTVFISTGFTGLYIVFVGAVPPHHCLIPHQANLTAEWRAVIVPTETAASGEERPSRCSRYRLDVVSNLSALGLIPGRDINLTDVALEGCVDGWSYSQDIFKSTIVTEVRGCTCVCVGLCVFMYFFCRNYLLCVCVRTRTSVYTFHTNVTVCVLT